MKVGGYKLSALEIEATLLDVSSRSSNAYMIQLQLAHITGDT